VYSSDDTVDSTVTKKSIVKGLRLSLVFYEKYLKEIADCLRGIEGAADLDMGLEGPGLPGGIEFDIHFGGENNKKLVFPVGYSYMYCKNSGKDENTYLKIHRHLIFAGVLYYFTEYEKGKLVPYLNGNLGYYIYGFRLKWDIDDKLLENVNQHVNFFDLAEFSYYLSGGLMYCVDKKLGFALGVHYNGCVDNAIFSISALGKI